MTTEMLAERKALQFAWAKSDRISQITNPRDFTDETISCRQLKAKNVSC